MSTQELTNFVILKGGVFKTIDVQWEEPDVGLQFS
jgi:hypothetical protein